LVVVAGAVDRQKLALIDNAESWMIGFEQGFG
jgi:hypothetical protein